MSVKVLRAIISGWAHYSFPISESMEALARQRAVICGKCEHANPEKKLPHMLPDRRLVEIKGLGCELCSCPLSTKLRQAITSCPDSPPRWK